MAAQNPETLHYEYPSNIREIETPLRDIEEKVARPGCIAAEDITLVDSAPIEGRGTMEGMLPFSRLQPGNMLHILCDKQRNVEELHDYYERVLLGRVVSDNQQELMDASPAVQLWWPLEFPSENVVSRGEIVELRGILHYQKEKGIELQAGAIQGNARFCVSHQEALFDIGTVAAIRAGTNKPYDDSHW